VVTLDLPTGNGETPGLLLPRPYFPQQDDHDDRKEHTETTRNEKDDQLEDTDIAKHEITSSAHGSWNHPSRQK
jgi:hypothetical protein